MKSIVMQGNDLTVVLTLKDRSSFTYRWMRWMEDQRFPYKILIADGGSDKEIERHLGNRRNYPNLDYDYIRYPYDSNAEMFVSKVADVASRVTTKFVMAADNDDLIRTSEAFFDSVEELGRKLVKVRGANANAMNAVETLGELTAVAGQLLTIIEPFVAKMLVKDAEKRAAGPPPIANLQASLTAAIREAAALHGTFQREIRAFG